MPRSNGNGNLVEIGADPGSSAWFIGDPAMRGPTMDGTERCGFSSLQLPSVLTQRHTRSQSGCT